ncbi:MAG: hypothetical protein DHS20C01_27810 [marine bacterium B5-7]|nr:MAG: hypothetical protein DHS20C01_27810 [marine bacterium B5-7]
MRNMFQRFIAATAMLIVVSPVMGDALNFDIDSSAELRKVAMYQKNIRKASSEQLVIFEVTLQNVDTVPRLYSVIVHIPGVGAGEDFAPQKGDELIEPGAEATASVAVLADTFPTNGYSIVVRPIEER